MVRKYQRSTNRLPESERGLRVIVAHRRQPDLELLARIIVDMAMNDPLDLRPSDSESAVLDLDRRENRP